MGAELSKRINTDHTGAASSLCEVSIMRTSVSPLESDSLLQIKRRIWNPVLSEGKARVIIHKLQLESPLLVIDSGTI